MESESKSSSTILGSDFLQRSTQLLLASKYLKPFYSWSKSQQNWISINSNQKFLKDPQETKGLQSSYNQVKSIKSVQFNVLFDFRRSDDPDEEKGHMKFSKERYTKIFEELEKMQCDVITLNEVTKSFVKMAQECEWVKQRYLLSVCHDSPDFKRSFGNLIMTRLTPVALHWYKVPSLPRPAMTAFFGFETNSEGKYFLRITDYRPLEIISFTCIHLISLDKNFKHRQFQMKELMGFLNQFNGIVSQHVIQGDLNFHSEKENQWGKENNLLDCWWLANKIDTLEQLKLNPGFTFDSEKNGLIQEMYWGFENRKMRLDRIYTSNHYPELLFEPTSMKVIFTQPIYGEKKPKYSVSRFTSPITFLGDMMGKNPLRKKQDYLFCSDHFGLQVVFKLSK